MGKPNKILMYTTDYDKIEFIKPDRIKFLHEIIPVSPTSGIN